MNNNAIGELRESSIHTPNNETIAVFKETYGCFDRNSIDSLGDFYAIDVIFTDAVHSISGLHQLKKYFTSLCDNLTSCRFEFIDETLAQDNAWFKWRMHYQHPRLQGGKTLQLTGATHIQFDTSEGNHISGPRKIVAHEDFYDMGAMLYEHTPVLGSMIRWLKKQLAQY